MKRFVKVVKKYIKIQNKTYKRNPKMGFSVLSVEVKNSTLYYKLVI